jgi:flavin reductase (DIM6/NTAB) family NADH-FMN oxidoreductase RutF/rubredoxin
MFVEGLNMLDMNTKAMYKLSYGLFICTAVDGDKMNGCVTNTAIQVASDPNLISLAINKSNYTHDMVVKTGECNISVISNDADFELFKHFGFQSGRDVDKFADFKDYAYSPNEVPYITKGTNAYFSLYVQRTVDLGSHTLFIAVPVAMEVLSDDPSATYAYYQSDIKPKPEAVKKTEDGKTVWRCKICGYEYVGEELPEDFICPICKHPASDFEKVSG